MNNVGRLSSVLPFEYGSSVKNGGSGIRQGVASTYKQIMLLFLGIKVFGLYSNLAAILDLLPF